MIELSEQGKEDKRKLSSLLKTDLQENEFEAFTDMHKDLGEYYRELTFKQRAWVDSRYEQLGLDAEDGSANLYSKGLVPMGKPVETPEVLKNLPKRPPSRKVS